MAITEDNQVSQLAELLLALDLLRPKGPPGANGLRFNLYVRESTTSRSHYRT
jgi:hypothetical protein